MAPAAKPFVKPQYKSSFETWLDWPPAEDSPPLCIPAPRWQSVVDFVVVLVAVCLLLVWGKQAWALRIALGIVGLRGAAILAQQPAAPCIVVTSGVSRKRG